MFRRYPFPLITPIAIFFGLALSMADSTALFANPVSWAIAPTSMNSLAHPTPHLKQSIKLNPLAVRRLLDTRQCQRCDLVQANLSFNNLRGVDLRDADLYQADLKLVDLRDALLSGANLVEADLRGADLTGAEITGTDFTNAKLCGAIFPDGTKRTDGCPPPERVIRLDRPKPTP